MSLVYESLTCTLSGGFPLLLQRVVSHRNAILIACTSELFGHLLRGADAPPGSGGLLGELERQAEKGATRDVVLGPQGAMTHRRKGRLDRIGGAQVHPMLDRKVVESQQGIAVLLQFLQVGGAQQVLLEVKVAEISRSFIKRMDIRFTGIYDGSIKIGTVGGGATFPDATFLEGGRVSSFPIGSGGLVGPAVGEVSPALPSIDDRGWFLNSLSGNFLFNVLIDTAREQGLAKILAEPNLTALSGQEAKFLAGGEFPIPVAQGNDAVSIEFKEFGIGLAFLPIVLDSGLVSLKVNVSVSELSNDGATALAIPGSASVFPVPSLITRSANSSVEVPSGPNHRHRGPHQ